MKKIFETFTDLYIVFHLFKLSALFFAGVRNLYVNLYMYKI